jgi:hypothetical protein
VSSGQELGTVTACVRERLRWLIRSTVEIAPVLLIFFKTLYLYCTVLGVLDH